MRPAEPRLAPLGRSGTSRGHGELEKGGRRTKRKVGESESPRYLALRSRLPLLVLLLLHPHRRRYYHHHRHIIIIVIIIIIFISLSSSTPRPRRLTPTALPPRARGDLRNRLVAFVRFVPLARSVRARRASAFSATRKGHRNRPRARERARERRRESPARTLTRGGQLR